ncbi:MAG: DUF2927 domain-containing protein [Arenibacterium sp.]
MSFAARRARLLCALVLAAALSACVIGGPGTLPAPATQPAAPETPRPQSAASAELSRYYMIVQNDQLTRGLLRRDGGGPDTPFTSDQLARNFERIVFFEEYRRSGGATLAGNETAGRLARWDGPVRVASEFGDSVPAEMREKERRRVAAYASRLGRITSHPVRPARGSPNFHVLFAGEDDDAFVESRLREIIPTISDADVRFFSTLPRSFYCLVIAVASERSPHIYDRAVALIRTEQPSLMREACIHEELAQGLGLPNDSPEARPSIFNDDDEFALLTNHDEMLLKMLYDPRLKAGMTAEDARPITRIIARELMGQAL